ncbi:unnamed protein product [Trichogramma brassicae]|uniref:C2H2-type domain-containing protein n=1 Tax=Trichogramma brassicae TaxID=86971 RepID=A0A6H5IKN9_9HYME|nr:unnamed protein product [Trichogramma brassicae]
MVRLALPQRRWLKGSSRIYRRSLTDRCCARVDGYNATRRASCRLYAYRLAQHPPPPVALFCCIRRTLSLIDRPLYHSLYTVTSVAPLSWMYAHCTRAEKDSTYCHHHHHYRSRGRSSSFFWAREQLYAKSRCIDRKAPLPNLLDVFAAADIERILNYAVEDPAGDAEDREAVIEFVAATGYRDQAPRPRGRPAVTYRGTPLHRLYHSRAPGDRDRMARALFRIYDRINVNYVESGHPEDPSAFSVSHFHVACCIGNGLELVRRFLDGGQDPNVVTRDDVTPLSLALTLRNWDVAELLLRRGALPHPRAEGKPSFSALHHLSKCCGDDLELVGKFFQVCDEIGRPLEINARDAVGDTPLHVALSYGCIKEEFLRLLLKKGADPNAANNAESTPLHVICQKHCVPGLLERFFSLVREDEKRSPVNIDARDSKRRTPLHLALRAGNHRAAAFLLQNGANPNLADEKNWTPKFIIYERYNESPDTVHEGFKNYACDQCEKKYRRKSHLLIHQRTVHESRKDYACDKCEKKFGLEHHLLSHQKIVHEGRKDYACGNCEKKFGLKTDLIRHQTTVHEGRKDYACDKCEKKFGQKQQLRRHQEIVHEGRKDFTCDKCEKKFGHKQHLVNHHRTVHEGRKDFASERSEFVSWPFRLIFVCSRSYDNFKSFYTIASKF